MKIKTKLALVVLVCIGLASCKKDLTEQAKYKRPSWLAGKIYTQIEAQPELSTFAECIKLTGYDTIINVSGSYTVFAPTNDAFDTYLSNHSAYNTINDIPLPFLTDMVKYLIVQNPWSKDQLESLDVYGWIDSTDINNNKPRGFKRETLLREPDRFYGVDQDKKNNMIIVDSASTPWHRKVYTDSRKYVPIFFKKYLDVSDLTKDDYSFYFDRPFEADTDIYFAGARVLGQEIFAENGFIYDIDKVVEPLKNGEEILSTEKDGNSYTDFLSLVHQFPEFTYNQSETFKQPGADIGLQVDSLFNLTYPDLAFDISNEETSPPLGTFGLPSNVTIRYHHGLVAPTNQAFTLFINDYLAIPGGWGTLKNAPANIKRIIVNTNMAVNAIYPSEFNKGFYNGEGDYVPIDENTIVQKEYGSNCSFIGVNKALVPRAFKSVTGPVYLRRGYSTIMYAIEKSGLLSALKKRDQNYSFYVEPDVNLRVDSSLIYNESKETFSVFSGSGASAREIPLSNNDLRTILLNHIGTQVPKGIARKEFILNLAGNYLVINNETGEVSGTGPTTIRYNGTMQAPDYPVQISTDADNGATYNIDNWFSFTAPTIYGKISTSYPYFHALLKKAGLSNDKAYNYTFISDNENYTVFVPTSEALTAFGADTLTGKRLVNFLKLHFVQGDIIFTDGNATPGFYETTRIDEKSTTYTKIFTKIYIDPEYDMIKFPDKSGNNYLTVNESDSTNFLTGRTLGDGTENIPITVNNAVIHQISKVLTVDSLDSE